MRISGFGIARGENNIVEQTLDIGTPYYMSPELLGLIQCDYNCQPDIWAAGILLYKLMYGEFPFD